MDDARAILAAAGIDMESLHGRLKGRPAKKRGRKLVQAE